MVVFTLIAKVFLFTFCLLSLNSVFESKILVQDVAKYIIQRTDNDVFGVEFRNSCTEQRCEPTSQLGKWCENQSAGQTNEQLGQYSCGCNSPLTTFLPEIGKCMNNSEVLATLQKGCSYYYKSWNNIFLKTLNLANNSTIHHYDGGLQSCRLLPESTEYYNEVLMKWERINTDIFSVHYDSGRNGVVLKWRADSNGKLSGRILRLAVTCSSSNDNRPRTGCILNKVKGKIKYNYLSKRTSTVQESSGPLATVPSLVVSETQQLLLSSSGKEKAVRSTTVIVTAVSILLQPSAMSVLNFSPTRATFSSVTTSAVTTGHIPVGLSSTKSTKSTTNSVPSSVVISASDSPTTGILDQGHKDARKKGNKEEVVIGAAVGAAVVFGVLIIIVIVVSCKCRKPGERKDKKTKLEVKNPVYGKTQNDIQMGKTKGSRESMDQDSQPRCLDIIPESGTMNEGAVYSTLDDYDDQECPAYQSLDKKVQSVAPVYQSLQKEPSLRNPTPKHKLSTTRQPTEKPSVPPDPVYNVLEESNARQGDVSEVLYNVLEGPDPGRDTPSKIQDPVYNVLDGPDAGQTYEAPDFGVQQDPLYNVLEVPESKQEPQEPLYNVLESADAKSASSTQHGPYDGAVSEPLYNVLDGADSDRANVSGAEYAALNRPLSGRDNPAYEQTLEFGVPNAVVHSPGSQRESFYEPLEGSDRQDVYEPLQKKGK